MLQFLLILVSGIVGFTLAVYQDYTSGNDISTNGHSYGYGYSGGFSGIPTLGEIPFGPENDFKNLFINLNKFQQNLIEDRGGGAYSYSHTYSSPNSKVKALSSITFTAGNNALPKRIKSQATAAQNNVHSRSNFPGAGGGYGFGNGNGGSFGGSFSGVNPDGTNFKFIPGSGVSGTFTPDGQGATAFGSVSPEGVHQGAFIFPENPNTPNVNVRFGSEQPDGFKSVFSSSSSYTRNVNGQPKTIQKASTTVNDNGKVTTYTRESPGE